MWQTLVIGIAVVAGLVYTVRHFLRIFKAQEPVCSGCSGCSCATSARALQDPESLEASPPPCGQSSSPR
ncbi:Virus attachment protein p12 family protein [Desulfacinum hydrothermale DSM 13146]|uniref:Virus attachment protein p12 family protein n=1 Tax=Desulfacinum hydrothermale DSM 13146 TaxID=1121390 RepID=A0A1W1X080_9BACT|nr:Virus attachment protein p12 family protein [Desulfacinum hydrothermale DSM 13146]